MKIHNRWLWQSVLGALAIFAGVSLGGCESAGYRRQVYQPTQSTEEKNIVIEESLEQEEEILPGISQMTPDGSEYDRLKDLPVPETEPAPEYYRVGVEHEQVAKLQERLMELGFMDNDEPT